MSTDPRPIPLHVDEWMRGYITPGATDYDSGFVDGLSGNGRFVHAVAIEIDDIEAFTRGETHSARLEGTITCAALGGEFPVRGGVFQMFTGTGTPGLRKMRYAMPYTDAVGRRRTILGHKTVHDDHTLDLFSDTTTLYVRVLEGEVTDFEAPGPVVAMGTLHIEVPDLFRSIASFASPGATAAEATRAFERFGGFFLGSVWKTFGHGRKAYDGNHAAPDTVSLENGPEEFPAISRPISELRDHYTAVVVGSGYGGAISASRLARAGQDVCLLERGREIRPGQYPKTESETMKEFQLHAAGTGGDVKGHPTGLYEVHLQKDISIFKGCGLGGTSLINANVAIQPDLRVFDDPCWPGDVRADIGLGYARALKMLGSTPLPDRYHPRKMIAHEKSGEALGVSAERVAINVTFDAPAGSTNLAGVAQRPCTMCGDCVTGCNDRAKNTLLMNYLPDAAHHGAEIFTEVEVTRIARGKGGKGWQVFFRLTGAGREKFHAPELMVTADLVVLGAGALGSTGILLRSRDAGLPTSDRLGYSFSGNGDVLGFGYDCEAPVNAVGWGSRTREEMVDPDVGPCITSVIDLRGTKTLDDGMIIEEGTLPGSLGRQLARSLILGDLVLGRDTDTGLLDGLKETGAMLANLVGSAYRGAINRTQVYLVMAHDGAAGKVVLGEGQWPQVEWPGAGTLPTIEAANSRLFEATRALGGTYIRNPLWTKDLHDTLVTVHPLGGCAMGATAGKGVVDHKGRVFSGASGEDASVHEGLYVADGSVIPRSLGVNPLLTISALAERTVEHIARDRGWTFDVDRPAPPANPTPVQPVGVRFTERMAGHVTTDVTETDFSAAEKAGRLAASPAEFLLTMFVTDLDALLADPNFESRIAGTVTIPALSPDAMTVNGGRFTLFARAPGDPKGRVMKYRMRLVATDGAEYFFDAFKSVHDDPGFDMWQDTTTLFTTVSRGAAIGGPIVARGILHIAVADFMRQLSTASAMNARGKLAAAAAVARFAKHFAATLHDVYGLI